MRKTFVIGAIAAIAISMSSPMVHAKDIRYHEKVNLRVGQSIILKGVRTRCDGKTAPSFASLRKLPRLNTGVLSDGGAGTVDSVRCKGRVPARAVRFTARKAGTERVVIYDDPVTIRVR